MKSCKNTCCEKKSTKNSFYCSMDCQQAYDAIDKVKSSVRLGIISLEFVQKNFQQSEINTVLEYQE